MANPEIRSLNGCMLKDETARAQVNQLSAEIGTISDRIIIKRTGNVFPLHTDAIDGYYLVENGSLISVTSGRFYGFIIDVVPNTLYSITNARFIVLLDSNKTPLPVESGKYAHFEDVTSVNSGDAEYMAIAFDRESYPVDDYVVSEGDELDRAPYAEYQVFKNPMPSDKNAKKGYYKLGGDIAAGGYLYKSGNRTELRKNARVVFAGDFDTFGTLTIGRRYVDVSNSRYFVITNSNISFYSTASSTPVTVEHNVTIAQTIKVIIEEGDTGNIFITIMSKSGRLFRHEFTGYTSNAGAWFASPSVAMTNCELVWTSPDIDAPIWIFGDSYLQYSPSRWTYYLHQYGHDNNCLLSGWPGEASNNGAITLETLMTMGTPKYAVWAYGMNDGSDSTASPPEAWATSRDRFLAACKSEDVTPVFCTIPSVPSINHEQKNAWVHSSGYRYIDFAKSVGASADGVWFDGMLSDDGIHPTETGAQALFAQALIDLPELMSI